MIDGNLFCTHFGNVIALGTLNSIAQSGIFLHQLRDAWLAEKVQTR